MEIRFTIQKLMLSLTILYCILFPADKINIKEWIFISTLVVCAPPILGTLNNKKQIILTFYALVFPAILTLYAFTFGDSTFYMALSLNYVWMYLLLVPAIIRYKFNIKKTFFIGTTIVALVTDFIFLADFLDLISIFSNPLVLFLSRMNELQYGKGLYSTFGYSIFYKSLPLAFLSYGYALKYKKIFLIVIYIMAFFVCGTRANLLVALCMSVSIPLLTEEKPGKKLIVVIVLICLAIFIFPSFLDYYIQRSNLKYDRSDLVKIEAVKSIFRFMNNKKIRYLFGSGIGSYFYSTGRNAYVNIVEASFFDYFRQVGILGYLFFTYFLVKPFLKYSSEERWVLISYVGYLAVAFTNPLLVTSTSFMVYVLLYSKGMSSLKNSIF